MRQFISNFFFLAWPNCAYSICAMFLRWSKRVSYGCMECGYHAKHNKANDKIQQPFALCKKV